MGRRGYYYLLMYRMQRELLVYFRFYFAIPHKIEKKLEKDEMNIACANKWMMRNHGKRKVWFLFSTCFTSPPPELNPECRPKSTRRSRRRRRRRLRQRRHQEMPFQSTHNPSPFALVRAASERTDRTREAADAGGITAVMGCS